MSIAQTRKGTHLLVFISDYVKRPEMVRVMRVISPFSVRANNAIFYHQSGIDDCERDWLGFISLTCIRSYVAPYDYEDKEMKAPM